MGNGELVGQETAVLRWGGLAGMLGGNFGAKYGMSASTRVAVGDLAPWLLEILGDAMRVGTPRADIEKTNARSGRVLGAGQASRRPPDLDRG